MKDRTRQLLALAGLVVCGLLVYVFRDRLSADFWPLDRSFVGPNLLASGVQYVAVGLIAVLVYPPLRRRVSKIAHKFVDDKLAPVHDHFVELYSRHDHSAARQHALSASLDDLHAKLDSLVAAGSPSPDTQQTAPSGSTGRAAD